MNSQNERNRPQSSETTAQNAIQERAYELYMKRGQEPGHELEDWFQAEQEVSGRQRRQISSPTR